jgi:SecD/SecF fusion protein
MEDPKRVRELLQGTANLEFWETYENSEVIGYLSQANNLLREIKASSVKSDTTKISPAGESAPADTTKANQSLEDLIGKDTS